jgi:hypothetical protein
VAFRFVKAVEQHIYETHYFEFQIHRTSKNIFLLSTHIPTPVFETSQKRASQHPHAILKAEKEMTQAVKNTGSEAAALAVYRLRDELIRTHNPANEYEKMLVTQISQSWFRLQRAHDAEQRYFQDRDLLAVITTPEFKAITRYVTDCERAWRRATEALAKTQRQRRRETMASPNARRAADRTYPPAPPEPASRSGAVPQIVAQPRE